MKNPAIVLGLVFATIVFFAISAFASPPENGEYRVTRIVDGDTVILEGGHKIRYLGVNTPEHHQPFYKRATAENRRLVLGKSVHVAFCKSKPKDEYGRYLGYLIVGKTAVSEALIIAGLAGIYDDAGCDDGYLDRHWRELKKAYKNGKGMWIDAPKSPIAADEAAGHVDQYRMITGTPTSIKETDTHLFLNFGPDWRGKDFACHFPKDNLFRFEKQGVDPRKFKGRNVVVFGRILKRKFGPYVTIYSPEQIRFNK